MPKKKMFARRARRLAVNGIDTKIAHVGNLCTKGGITSILKERLIHRDELRYIGEYLKGHGVTVNFTTGTYDLIHPGHVRYLYIASHMGDQVGPRRLFVGLNSDASVKRYKDPSRPILDQLTRAEMLAALGFVDFVTIYDEINGAEVIRHLKPDNYLCVEGSWEGDLATKEEVKAMAKVGGKVYVSPRQGPTISTSEIIHKIATSEEARRIAEALRKSVRSKA